MAKSVPPLADLDGTWRRTSDDKEVTITVEGATGAITLKGPEYEDWEYTRYSTALGFLYSRRSPKKGPEGQETREITQVDLPEWAKLKALDDASFHWNVVLDIDSGRDHITRDNCDLRFTGALLPGRIKAHVETETIEIVAPEEPTRLKPKPKDSIEISEHSHKRFLVPELGEWLQAGWADETAADAAFDASASGYGALCAEDTITALGKFGRVKGFTTAYYRFGEAIVDAVISSVIPGGGIVRSFATKIAENAGKKYREAAFKDPSAIDNVAKVTLQAMLTNLNEHVVDGEVRAVAQKGLTQLAAGAEETLTKKELKVLSEYLKKQCRFQFVTGFPSELDKETPVGLMTGIVDSSRSNATIYFHVLEHKLKDDTRTCPWSLTTATVNGLPDESRQKNWGGRIKVQCSVVAVGRLG